MVKQMAETIRGKKMGEPTQKVWTNHDSILIANFWGQKFLSREPNGCDMTNDGESLHKK